MAGGSPNRNKTRNFRKQRSQAKINQTIADSYSFNSPTKGQTRLRKARPNDVLSTGDTHYIKRKKQAESKGEGKYTNRGHRKVAMTNSSREN